VPRDFGHVPVGVPVRALQAESAPVGRNASAMQRRLPSAMA
jgi:hypothetical protein